VYLQLFFLHSVLHVDQCIYIFFDFTLCYMETSVSTPYYTSLCYLISMHRNSYILHTVLHIDQYIYSFFFFTLCYMQINVSTPYFSLIRVTCRSVYLHLTIPHSVLQVGQCIYSLLFFTLCYK
jgi:hypothetical protein